MTDKNKPENISNWADTGNASNPSPKRGTRKGPKKNQLLNEKAEKYLRESGNIEDMPDATDLEEAEDMMDEKDELSRLNNHGE